MDYKETLNLPRTEFPMKANLPEVEPEILKEWEGRRLYEKIIEKLKDKEKFILHDGPPYANGHIHMGHALNKILKDIIIRYKSMSGYRCDYLPGWDCHGLPIELQVDKYLGQKKRSMSILEFRELCRRYASEYIDIQREEFKRLGVFGEWNNPYLTMDYKYEATIIRELSKFADRGGLVRRRKPVYWCISCETALAEAEVEYGEHESPSIYVKFPLIGSSNRYLVIWTTTPWTIPANLAIALHPDFEYAAIEIDKEIFILAEGLIENFIKEIGDKSYKIIERFNSSKIVGKKCRHPYINRDSLIINSLHVNLDIGSGCVHIAPGHGEEDYQLGLEYGLDIYSPVDKKGVFNKDVEYFAGINVFKANELIIKKLEEVGCLIKADTMKHSYPHCWRCKKPLIFRATDQWFISMDINDLRKRALKSIDSVKWIPPSGRDRIYGMILNRPDWCISRQRLWGVPIPVFYCKSCNNILVRSSIMEHVADMVEKDGADIWFMLEARELLPEGTRCERCNGTEFEKENDILDVWFDSGVSYAAVLKKRGNLRVPADMYLEGSDQHRGWFHSSLLASVGVGEGAPYRSVLTHGFVVDGDGRKMSKTLGNVISPKEIIDKFGAEIVRLWVASEDYKEDLRLSQEILKRLSEAYRKIRNTCRYMLGNIYDFDPVKDGIKYNKLIEIDRLALYRLNMLINRVRNAYEKYEFHIVFHSIHNFSIVEMSNFYLDVLKDRLYTFKKDSFERRSAQTVIYNIVVSIAKLIAPILPFTAEEVWRYIPSKKNNDSIHLTEFPEFNEAYNDTELAKRWNILLDVREDVKKALEISRNNRVIGSSLDALIDIKVEGEIFELLNRYKDELKTIFIVSEVRLNNDVKGDIYESLTISGLKIKVTRAPGKKCERCWNYSTTVGENRIFPSICDRCIKVLKEN